MTVHSKEQGLRVHHLTNLGGLVAIAGLDSEPPDLLLGALMRAANEIRTLPADQRRVLASTGHKRLDERAAEKRAFSSWLRAKDLHSLTLSNTQIAHILEALGAGAPSDPAALIPTLNAALKGLG